ncbi:hypothetical protein [Roseomonas sp. 18066]|uniref:hypothetical protein n=1 Tax=Roseomonas sp. 18066 TaxID=2681412 RepID=UPI001F2837EB|nr:hypothetical protein [Roseomonas sp. 18066]
MRWSIDARTPLRLLDAAQLPPGATVLAEDGAPLPPGLATVERFAPPPPGGHPIGCGCCAPRGQAAVALDRLFLGRVRGSIPWFDEVIAVAHTEAGKATILAALEDSVVGSRFRFREE